MRSYYSLLVLNLAVMVPLFLAMQFHILKKNLVVFLFACLALLVANYAITGKLARQRGTSSLELGLWIAWTGGPFAGAMCAVLCFMDSEFFLASAFPLLGMVYSAWTTVRKAEREGWAKIDPKGPYSLTEALRS
jgi:hypothetical protein